LSDERLAIVEALAAFARARGHTVLELAMSWLAARPTVASVTAGATTPAQVAANVLAAAAWRLGDEDFRDIDLIAPPA
jgi:aryl-alcohol dehydrogenase-like predicted oxidoreductase